MFGLIPKEEKFFILFQEMTKLLIEGATLLKELTDNFDKIESYQKKIKDVEHEGDKKTHEIIQKLNKTFITPIDREDIYDLAAALDDILDLIDASAQRMVLYKIQTITSECKSFAFIILKCCQALDKAIKKMDKKHEEVNESFVEINELENEADRVLRESLGKLFSDEKDPIRLIKWKEIYETLEKVTDKCEDAANIIETVVVKHA
ncbi:DUF47 domain-containing protein [Calditerrivibrio nitroreducens]|uniref:Putative phosphate transport regulator n=1 Tax=Calditerrivibrio nitroreducens (strain DSM 19672 / NBRC 101217 / Yu37-1) TaxID=768670 RepID=E4TIJ0_CALNY|nr:DUF47 family protein [Calditerrivibrio nitroreducens]ADR19038.1 putative phosphate transport regulator [Calditerrivibrio nitroreducens DSM 19672]